MLRKGFPLSMLVDTIHYLLVDKGAGRLPDEFFLVVKKVLEIHVVGEFSGLVYGVSLIVG